jgi:hypothetical protein
MSIFSKSCKTVYGLGLREKNLTFNLMSIRLNHSSKSKLPDDVQVESDDSKCHRRRNRRYLRIRGSSLDTLRSFVPVLGNNI